MNNKIFFIIFCGINGLSAMQDSTNYFQVTTSSELALLKQNIERYDRKSRSYYQDFLSISYAIYKRIEAQEDVLKLHINDLENHITTTNKADLLLNKINMVKRESLKLKQNTEILRDYMDRFKQNYKNYESSTAYPDKKGYIYELWNDLNKLSETAQLLFPNQVSAQSFNKTEDITGLYYRYNTDFNNMSSASNFLTGINAYSVFPGIEQKPL